jgi:septal ring factor EnvC (AmiA/AmiB activator)
MVQPKTLVLLIVNLSLVAGFVVNAGQLSKLQQQVTELNSELATGQQDRTKLETELKAVKASQDIHNPHLLTMILGEQKRINDLQDSLIDMKVGKVEESDNDAKLLEAVEELQSLTDKAIAGLGNCVDSISQTDRAILAVVKSVEELVGDDARTRITPEAMTKTREQLQNVYDAIREPSPNAAN